MGNKYILFCIKNLGYKMTKLENNYIFGRPDRKSGSLIIRGIVIQMHATLLVMTTRLTELCVM